jgi:hypothetical protein
MKAPSNNNEITAMSRSKKIIKFCAIFDFRKAGDLNIFECKKFDTRLKKRL